MKKTAGLFSCPFIIIFFLTISIQFAYSSPGVVKQSESLITSGAATWWDDRYGDDYLNCDAYIQDALVTYNGWQYASYYNTNRYVTIARRQLPGGAWEQCTLTDYQQTTNDNHNTISMGISPSDGRIHLSFDHHDSTLHYRKSVSGLAANPSSYSWTASQFGATENTLGSGTITSFTYPAFFTAPNATFMFYGRIGASGDGDNYIWKYNNNGSWTTIGRFIAGSGENAYHHGMLFDKNNRLHMTWCWRATSDGTTNHDLMYAYSDDYGSTWRNNAGSQVGITASDPITPSKDCKVWTIAQKTGLINSEGMIIDLQGRIHVFSREDISGTNYQMHYYRDTAGTWHRINTNIPTKVWDNRSKIAYDASGNVYAIMPHIQIASASASSNYSDWSVIDKSDDNRFIHSEPLIDFYNLISTGDLYVFVQAGTASSTSGNLYAIRYVLNPGTLTPNPGKPGDANDNGTVDIVDALLIAQYYVGLNPSGFVQANADVNCSGTIDIVDALLVAQYYVGLISQFCR
jgi:hypothetical protein